jgi:dTDP-4-amino-4,6-dideoxygalactose transaminase
MKVPFLDVRGAYLELQGELDAACRQVMDSGSYILGREVAAFEREFADYCGARYCVGVGNGLEALQLILRGWGIGEGDEVIVPANTYIASWLAVSQAGARPVPVEPDERTYNIDPARIEAAISPRTKAIMPVHLYGLPVDMAPVVEIARRFGLKIVEDAAHAHGARYQGRRAGSLGHAAAFSFYPSKNLGAFGDAGAVVTEDEALARRIAVLRHYGSEERYVNSVKGYNSRLDELHAAMLRIRLRHLDEWNERRRKAARLYRSLLADLPVTLPIEPAEMEHVWHLFVIRVRERGALQAHLERRGVATLIHYPIPPHMQRAYDDLGLRSGALPATEVIHREVLSLPMGPHLSEVQVRYVAGAVAECLGGKR